MASSLLETLRSTVRLPTPPAAAMQILRLCRDDDVAIGLLADAVALDPALSIRVLRYANSPIVGAAKRITSVREAVLALGIRSVRLMVLSFSLLSTGGDRACLGFDYEQFWRQALTRAIAARSIARWVGHSPSEEAFASALLVRIGRLLLAMGVPEQYTQVLVAGGGVLGSTEQAELEAFGVSGHEVGAELLMEWGLPPKLVEIVRHAEADAQPATGLLGIVRAACVATDVLRGVPKEDMLQAAVGALSPDHAMPIDELLSGVRTQLAEVAPLILGRPGEGEVDRIERDADRMLGELSLTARLRSSLAAASLGDACRHEPAEFPDSAAFGLRLATEWSDALRTQRSIGVIVVDLDGFSRFNELYGRALGDRVLQAIAGELPQAIRSVDFCGRLQGDEFAIILPRVDRLMVAQACVKLRKLVETCSLQVDSGSPLTASIGAVLVSRARPPLNAQSVLDAALAQANASRAKGGNQCSLQQFTITDQLAIC